MPDDTPDPPALPRKRGRPPSPEPGVSIGVWLPVSVADRLIRLARERDESVSGLIKTLLSFRLRDR
jgi:hypothetical protein